MLHTSKHTCTQLKKAAHMWPKMNVSWNTLTHTLMAEDERLDDDDVFFFLQKQQIAYRHIHVGYPRER
jgi:hypothetical protein